MCPGDIKDDSHSENQDQLCAHHDISNEVGWGLAPYLTIVSLLALGPNASLWNVTSSIVKCSVQFFLECISMKWSVQPPICTTFLFLDHFSDVKVHLALVVYKHSNDNHHHLCHCWASVLQFERASNIYRSVFVKFSMSFIFRLSMSVLQKSE